ncbi:unnamed protein product [Pleuronectes platessa]|uniref:Uncharacterized protein n=1 Tax=Pleuronectes platessa TaxID=8262 RepID=A0A9N7UG50_PLEPL|nr:unnamed protein product [Pleuronectes platessa]
MSGSGGLTSGLGCGVRPASGASVAAEPDMSTEDRVTLCPGLSAVSRGTTQAEAGIHRLPAGGKVKAPPLNALKKGGSVKLL